jgi:hypothetical protein
MNFEILEVRGDVYITTHENIGEGDWFIRGDEIHRCFRVHKTDIEFLTSIYSVYSGSNTFWNKEYCKKIILTTNKDLITNGVQKIDEESLEYLKQNSENVKIDLVAVNEFGSEITVNGYGFDKFIYKVIGPKVSLNSDHIFEEANFTKLENDLIKEAKKVWQESHPNPIEMAIFGAKYVQERMFSEEEVRKLLQVQRGNCFAAILIKTKDYELALLATSAHEPNGKDGWVKNFNV